MSTSPIAFRGLVCDFDRKDGGLAFTIEIDRALCGHFLVAVGVPPGVDRFTKRYELCPSVALLPCRTPIHPERDELVLAEAAIEGLIGLLQAGLRLTPNLAARFDAMRAQLDDTPIHIMPEPGDDAEQP